MSLISGMIAPYGWKARSNVAVSLKTPPPIGVGAGFLQDTRAWILFPTKIEFEISTDGKSFTKVLTIPNTVPDKDYKVQVKDFSESISPQKAQYVKVKAINYGKLPEWHEGYEDKGVAWLFIDELFIE